MNDEPTTSGTSPEALADAQTIADCVAAGKPVPPDVARRVRERADRIRQKILEEHGVQDIGVRIIREMRGELPE